MALAALEYPSPEAGADQALLKRALAGDHHAFDLLALRYRPRLKHLVMRTVKSVDDADDVVQDALLRAFRALPSFRGDAQFYTWLCRIAINVAKSHVTHPSRRLMRDAEPETEVPELTQFGPEHDLASEQLQAVIFSALQALPEALRTALTLREFEGLSYEEIGHLMQTPVGTVRSRIFRAREALDAAIAPLLEDNGL
ncbi:MAG: sigma-70 family RNA polymerase sigma factor [Pseudomonadales bacterium]|nr:sigma-70 family RNA polymerase sigma factor [Pseudomonadales bacterium]MBL6808688.1 sigma-70 family RNA polymerase sigma factor [Pseudomonadales bacterium]